MARVIGTERRVSSRTVVTGSISQELEKKASGSAAGVAGRGVSDRTQVVFSCAKEK